MYYQTKNTNEIPQARNLIQEIDNLVSRGKSQAEVLLKIVEEVSLFHSDLKEPHARIPIGDHNEIWPCRSRIFKKWLAKKFWDNQQKAPNSDALNQALNVIEGKAHFEGEEIALSNRIVWHEGDIWYDLADKKWRSVRIGGTGWEIIENTPILFRRYGHQRPQVEPITGGDVKALLKFVNINDDKLVILFLVYVIASFIPDFPHPVLSIYGAQGSSKSVLCKILRKLIDPSAIEVSGFPKDQNEFAQLLAHHWCIFFDNISHLPDWVSDMLCKAVSGDGFSKRELYSDDDDIIYTFKRCIGLNGINLIARKPDLLERSILLELERVSNSQRKREEILWKEFAREQPLILGGIFDTIVKAIVLKDSINLYDLPRMADFTLWGCAIAEALGFKKEEFLNAYYANIGSQNSEVLNENLVAITTRAFLDKNPKWEGTPSNLLEALTIVAQERGINTTQEKEWPKAANILSRRLNELKTNLSLAGINFSKGADPTGNERIIYLQKESENIVSSVESSETVAGNNVSDDTDDIPSNILE